MVATQEEKVNGSKGTGGQIQKQKGDRRRLWVGGAVIALITVAAGAHYFLFSRHRTSTDDAFIDGHVLPVSSKVAGQAVQVNVLDNQVVKKADVLLQIDAVEYRLKF